MLPEIKFPAVEQAWGGLRVPRSRAVAIALAGSLLLLAACGEVSSTGSMQLPTPAVPTATVEPSVGEPVEQSRLDESFSKVDRTIQDLIRPEFLKQTPDLQFSAPKLSDMEFYDGALQGYSEGKLLVEREHPPLLGKEAYRELTYIPDVSFGPIINEAETLEGRILSRHISFFISPEGAYQSSPRDRRIQESIPEGRFQSIARNILNIPDDLNLGWTRWGQTPGEREILVNYGKGQANGRQYTVRLSGYNNNIDFLIQGN